ncbi:MAG: hypothetical protein H7315_03345 [Herminiimonas sp.]|nr:hypothetical protein [Herminiimonas sp.]
MLDRDGKTLLSPIGAAEICIGKPVTSRKGQPRPGQTGMLSLASLASLRALLG